MERLNFTTEKCQCGPVRISRDTCAVITTISIYTFVMYRTIISANQAFIDISAFNTITFPTSLALTKVRSIRV